MAAPLRDLTERRIDGETLFSGRLLVVRRDNVRLPDGRTAVREYIVHPGAALIVPVLDDGRLLLERQFRYAAGQHFYEFPAGKCDPGEDPLATAQRELAEETGYRAREWEYLSTIHPCHAYSSEAIALYVARGLEAGAATTDEEEFVDLLPVTLADVLAWVEDVRITDAKTICALFFHRRFAGAGNR